MSGQGCPVTPLREGEVTSMKRRHQRPSGRADISLNAFEMLIFCAICPLSYSSETGKKKGGEGSSNRSAIIILVV